ncbi:MAG: L,D-transpeptidase family protein [Candidatus Moranbacteria bacterium]|jgi:lipoprotein-anchoring transpeptidase ErfK/SrfK|nr:L,D-transpeptidase family protein [Candidatus Moranbacteria bacterium]
MEKIYKLIIFLLLVLIAISSGVYTYAFSSYFTLVPQLENNNFSELLPSDNVVINFSKPIDAKYYKDNIKLVPETPMKAVMDDSRTRIIITPKTAWKVGTAYQINLPDGRAKNFMQIKSGEFNFETVGYPKVTEVTPANGAVDVQLDIEDPIVVKFDKSTKDFFIDFRLSPEAEVKYKNNEEKNQFEILPQENLADDTLYTLTIFAKAKNAKDEDYYRIHRISFTTLPPKPISWAQDLAQRVEQAKRFTAVKIKEGKYIDVNLSTQIMTIFENGKVINSFLISSGKRGMDTPKGEHQIYNKHPRPWSKKYGLFMPFWMAITSDGKFGIHELPEWPGGYKEGQNHLGIPVSHGCMRLGVEPAETVYGWAEIGTKVIVY